MASIGRSSTTFQNVLIEGEIPLDKNLGLFCTNFEAETNLLLPSVPMLIQLYRIWPMHDHPFKKRLNINGKAVPVFFWVAFDAKLQKKCILKNFLFYGRHAIVDNYEFG